MQRTAMRLLFQARMTANSWRSPPQCRYLAQKQRFHCFATAMQAAAQPAALESRTRVFADHTFYKGRAAMAMKVIGPRWQDNTDGSSVVSRPGVLLLEFAPVQQGLGTQPGERRYEWSKKQTFAMQASELALLVEATSNPSVFSAGLLHDPNKLGRDEGSVLKRLSFQQMENSKDAVCYMSISVQEAGQSLSYGVPLQRADLALIRILGQHLVPHLLGWDVVTGMYDARGPEGQSSSYSSYNGGGSAHGDADIPPY